MRKWRSSLLVFLAFVAIGYQVKRLKRGQEPGPHISAVERVDDGGTDSLARYDRSKRTDSLVQAPLSPPHSTQPKTNEPAANSILNAEGDSLSGSNRNRLANPLRRAQGAALFHYLFDGGLSSSRSLTKDEVHDLEERFTAPYDSTLVSKHVSAQKREEVDRIGLLKALEGRARDGRDRDVRQDLAALYESILNRDEESRLVKRQALRNLNRSQGFIDERERQKIISQLDSDVVSSSALGDLELVEASIESLRD